jgi:hypothetical protein
LRTPCHSGSDVAVLRSRFPLRFTSYLRPMTNYANVLSVSVCCYEGCSG